MKKSERVAKTRENVETENMGMLGERVHKCTNVEGGGGLEGLPLMGGVKGLFWALLPAIIRLSLGDSLINAAFLQLTSKVTGIVGTQPLPFAAAPEEGNGHIIHFPRGFFPPFPPFLHLSWIHTLASSLMSVCLSVLLIYLPFLFMLYVSSSAISVSLSQSSWLHSSLPTSPL